MFSSRDEQIENLYEIFPEKIIDVSDMGILIVYEYLKRFIPQGVPLRPKTILFKIKNTGIDKDLVKIGHKPLSLRTKCSSCLFNALHTLWKGGYLRKFVKGIYQRTGRPYGVHYMLDLKGNEEIDYLTEYERKLDD